MFDDLPAHRRVIRRCRWLTDEQTSVKMNTGFH
jgi:hypothetical protein